jgi:2-polyprenyl-6-methoxyphenol hydroxylase-like FAD-dependent oxidoreductase
MMHKSTHVEKRSESMIETDVLVVGAGPTGLALATFLQKEGVDHLLVDALPEGQSTSRAGVVHPHTLEVLDTLGVVGELQAQGLSVDKFTVRDRDEALLTIGFQRLPSAFKHILMIPQPATERTLAEAHERLGGTLLRNAKATHVRRETDHVVVSLEHSGKEQRVRAKYVVGADGMHSTVRAATDIRFEGAAYAESFVLADVHMDWPLGQSEVSLCFSRAGLVVVAPLPDGTYRIVATMEQAPEKPNMRDVQKLLDERGPKATPAKVRDIVWSSRFRVHHRLASSYRDGRVLLMGDAAHVHSPAGGQGMNTGLVDAILLGKALTAVVRDHAPASTLDDYSNVRRSAAEQVLALAGRLTRMATVRSPIVRYVRNLVLRLLDHVVPFKAKLALQLSGISRRNLSALPTISKA